MMVSANAHDYSPGGDGNAVHDAFLIKPIDVDALLERASARCWACAGSTRARSRVREPLVALGANERAAAVGAPVRRRSWCSSAASAMCAASRPSCARCSRRCRKVARFAQRLLSLVGGFDMKGYTLPARQRARRGGRDA